jgi:hypothetical protein
MIAFVVAATSHTRVRRLPAPDGWGTRVHTLPDALAMAIAASPLDDLLRRFGLDLFGVVTQHGTSSSHLDGANGRLPGGLGREPKL